MGVIVSYLFNSKESSPEYNPKMVALTSDQVVIIKKTWEVPKANMEESGEAILFRFFEKYPNNQNKFNAFKNTPLLSLRGTPGFRNHGNNVIRMFDEAIATLDKEDSMEELNKLWVSIGKSHSRRKISKQSFLELKDVILEIMMSVCTLNEDQQNAWNCLFDNIFSIIFPMLGEQ